MAENETNASELIDERIRDLGDDEAALTKLIREAVALNRVSRAR